jgi:UDP-N-acetylmuramoylalanine--D-glutamate ligase
MFKQKKLLILGLGISGRSAAHFLLAQGADVSATDFKLELLYTNQEIQQLIEKGLKIYEEKQLPALSFFDYLIISPGIPSTHSLIQEARRASIPYMGEIALGCLFVQQPILGITGTNGKTTVTLLTTHVLNHSHQLARALGNIGVPLTQALLDLKDQEKIVLELSSYQLETLHQPLLDAAIILNITPDHLDRYLTLENYAQAKCQIEMCLKPNAYLYLEEQTVEKYHSLFKTEAIRLYGYHHSSFISTDLFTVFREGQPVFSLPLALQGYPSHEIENLLAAFALCSDQGVSGEQFIAAYSSFQKPAHRIEFVVEYRGIKFIDDSKGTNIDAVTRAVQSLQGSIHLIAGGVDKGSSYHPWIKGFRDKVKSICAIGQAAAKIKAQLSPSIPVNMCQTLEEAVQQASHQAQPGDYVLLSPGCSSFDMFKDYVHRGEEFQRIVHAWTKEVRT